MVSAETSFDLLYRCDKLLGFSSYWQREYISKTNRRYVRVYIQKNSFNFGEICEFIEVFAVDKFKNYIQRTRCS